MRRAVALTAVVAATGAALSALAGAGARPAAAAGPALEAFPSCEAFLDSVHASALELLGPWGLETDGPRPLPLAVDAAEAGAPADTAAASQQASLPEFSTTNVQEAGVDEPDIVKSDGSRVFAVSNGTLFAVDVTGPQPRLAGSLPLPGGEGAQQLLLHGDTLVVLTQPPFGVLGDPAAEIAPSHLATTTLLEIDVSDLSALRVTESLTVEGSLVAGRLAGSTARVVVVSGPPALPFVSPGEPGAVDEEAAEQENRRLVLASGPAEWLPSYRLESAETGLVERGRVDCADVSRPPSFSGLGLVTVFTLDLDRGLAPVDADAVAATAETVYASPSSLYVATQRWSGAAGEGLPSSATTEIHRFDASVPGETEYRSSGSVPGFLIGQFALSEHRGFLRVASTEEAPWSSPGGSESRVTVLAEEGRALRPVGAVSGLGKGERIYAVRFLGDLGYVVTFRRVDPLYTLDLSDPTAPRVTGELKLPGYSSYLHPAGDGVLLGVGQDATLEGQALGTQVSLFDVSDPLAPALVARRSLSAGWSEVEHDHHAFLYWPRTGLAVVPVDAGAAVGLRVGPASLDVVGLVEHPGAPIRRSLVVGETLYTISSSGLEASDLETLADEGWVRFA